MDAKRTLKNNIEHNIMDFILTNSRKRGENGLFIITSIEDEYKDITDVLRDLKNIYRLKRIMIINKEERLQKKMDKIKKKYY